MPFMTAPDHDLATQFRRFLATPKERRSQEVCLLVLKFNSILKKW